jgi:hypothetical protein
VSGLSAPPGRVAPCHGSQALASVRRPTSAPRIIAASRMEASTALLMDERARGRLPPAGKRYLVVDDGHDRRDAPLAIDIFGYDCDDVVGGVVKFRHRDRPWTTRIGRDHADKER